jgi:competence protein ComEC
MAARPVDPQPLVSVEAGNRYRHPDPGLIGGLERAGAAVHRTDTAGDVAVMGRPGEGPGPPLEIVARGSPLPAPRRRIMHLRAFPRE